MAKKKARKPTHRLVLLDAHAILHRAYHALPDFTAPDGTPTGALYGVVSMLLKIIEELKPHYLAACFDLPEPTYRHEAYEGYKAGRAPTDEALALQIERSRSLFDAFGIRIYEHAGFEADDILGTIAAQTASFAHLEVIIASGDMDTLQLVEGARVQVYTLRKGIKDTVLYNERVVKERFGFAPTHIPDYKGLRGDPSDNIPGVPGIGEKTATALISACGSLEAVLAASKHTPDLLIQNGVKARTLSLLNQHAEEAEFSKMLATIRRDAPISFTLPERTWREKLDQTRILSLFGELGFRTPAQRVKALFSDEQEKESGSGDTKKTAAVPPAEGRHINETAIALWLLSSDITNPTYDDIIAYARNGGEPAFKEARVRIMADLKKNKLLALFEEVELPLMEVIAQMERNGVLLDVSYLSTLSLRYHKELAGIEKTIYRHAGGAFNINSPKQLADVLYDTLGLKPARQKRTATGQRSTREAELQKLADAHPVIPEVLRYRELQKLVSTYIDTLPAMTGPDGRLHTTFLQAGTTTGRMASRDPNLQNIPIKSHEGRAIRKGFVAEAGYTLVAIDYSQIELRIAAILSGDAKLIDIFVRGEDVHRGVALRVFGVNADEVTDAMRRKAKVINFGILYGMGVNALRNNLGEGTTRADAQAFLNAYFHTFTRLAEYLEQTKAGARANGHTTTLFGRKRHFPGINASAPFVRAQAERMAINAPIQGSQADIIRIAMVRIHAHLQKEGVLDTVRMILQVHDELVFEIKDELVAGVVPSIVSIMELVLRKEETKGVPIRAEAKYGTNWEEMRSFPTT